VRVDIGLVTLTGTGDALAHAAALRHPRHRRALPQPGRARRR
jgi:hypothetical protein